jgi:hypothetical protein
VGAGESLRLFDDIERSNAAAIRQNKKWRKFVHTARRTAHLQDAVQETNLLGCSLNEEHEDTVYFLLRPLWEGLAVGRIATRSGVAELAQTGS